MIRRITIMCTIGLFTLNSWALHAQDTVRVTVHSKDDATFGVGFSVNGKVAGAIGKSYTGLGPKNQKYLFGYRRSALYGKNISCGSLTLTEDSVITLVIKDNKCVSTIK